MPVDRHQPVLEQLDLDAEVFAGNEWADELARVWIDDRGDFAVFLKTDGLDLEGWGCLIAGFTKHVARMSATADNRSGTEILRDLRDFMLAIIDDGAEVEMQIDDRRRPS